MCAIGRSYAVRSRRLMLQSFIFRLQEHPIAYNVRSVFYMKMKIVIIVGIDVTAGQISCVMWIVEYANYILKNNIHRGAHHFHLEWIFYAAQKMHAYIWPHISCISCMILWYIYGKVPEVITVLIKT